jgi:hypothetical protein
MWSPDSHQKRKPARSKDPAEQEQIKEELVRLTFGD